MHSILENRLKNAITGKGISLISDVWEVFKSEFSILKGEEHPQIVDLGIQSELYSGSEFGPACYYFAFYYQIKTVEYTHYELVYCEFDLSSQKVLPKIENWAIDIWLSEFDETELFKQVEDSYPFELFKQKSPLLNVYGTEV